ncbi:MAG: energy-coupling factor transporter transmembrane protein EcfT [Clostridia bacterium]|nr:energy-coupling factor transporter transmembrane protein EcfT [Clostridia bacterium]
MSVFMYQDINSFLHKLDPRVKLLVMLTFFVYALMFLKNAALLAVVFLFVLVYAAMGRSLGNVLHSAKVLLTIFLVTVIVWILTTPGPTKIILWFSVEGLLRGISGGFSLVIIIITSIVFISTTKIEELTMACIRLGLPYRGAFATSTAIRMIPLIADTATTILQAQKSRGLDVDTGSFMQKLKKYVPLMVPTIVSVIRGTTVFAMALESKGFGYSEKRTNYIVISYKLRDYLFSLVLLLLIALAVFIKLYFKV